MDTPKLGVTKLIVGLPTKDVNSVIDMANTQGKTKTQILREAIVLKAFIDEYLEGGCHLLIEHNGNTKEVVFTC